MPKLETNGAELTCEVRGDGPPLVMVHGSWTDHETWHAVVGPLAERFRVIVYSRRGHSLSTRPPGPMTRDDHVRDLEAVIERVAGGPVRLVGNSFGALISLALVAERPDLVVSCTGHEPPYAATQADDPRAALIGTALRTVDEIIDAVRAGNAPAATRRFMDEVVFGPGAWDQTPDGDRRKFIGNSAEFVEDLGAAGWSHVDIEELSRFTGPLVITKGRASPAWLPAAVDVLVERLPNAGTATLPGGHVPHFSHPEDYLGFLGGFLGAEVAVV